MSQQKRQQRPRKDDQQPSSYDPLALTHVVLYSHAGLRSPALPRQFDEQVNQLRHIVSSSVRKAPSLPPAASYLMAWCQANIRSQGVQVLRALLMRLIVGRMTSADDLWRSCNAFQFLHACLMRLKQKARPVISSNKAHSWRKTKPQ